MAKKKEPGKKVDINLFKSLNSYIKYWDKAVAKTLSTNNGYADFIKQMKSRNESEFKSPGEEEISWFGFPVPTSVEDAMSRKSFMNMPLYDVVYERLKPFLALLEKASVSVIPKEVIVPTDLELGVFSFERAMMGIEGVPGLYSPKHKKYASVEDGDPVLDKDGKQTFTNAKKPYTYFDIPILKGGKPVFENGKQMFTLAEYPKAIYRSKAGKFWIPDGADKSKKEIIPPGTELWLQQLKKDGDAQWGSSNKKSFLKKEFYKRPSNAVRIFVYIGGNAGQDTYWSGLIATIAAQFLQTKGYSIRITAVIGVASQQGYFNFNYKKINESPELKLWVDPDGTEYNRGARYSYIDIKDYTDTIDSLTLLYLVADPSFFRVRVFEYLTAQQFINKDPLNTGLGRIEENSEFKEAFYSDQKKRNIEEEKNTLYYFLGGRDFLSSRMKINKDTGLPEYTDIDEKIESAKKNLLEIICNAENTNKKIMKDLGYEFEPVENPDDYSVFIGGVLYSCIEKDEDEEAKNKNK